MIALSRRLPATRSLDALWTVSILSVRLEENWEKKMQALIISGRVLHGQSLGKSGLGEWQVLLLRWSRVPSG